MEIPFGGDNIILAVLLSYRFSSARIQYMVLEKSQSSGMTFSITSFTFYGKSKHLTTYKSINLPRPQIMM